MSDKANDDGLDDAKNADFVAISTAEAREARDQSNSFLSGAPRPNASG